MVLLKEISEGIWGLPLGPNANLDVVTQHPIRLTMAALEIDEDSPPSGLTRVTLKSATADNGPPTDLILCNLHYPSCLQQPLDIELYDGQTLSFAVKGPHRVHLTGYRLQPESEESETNLREETEESSVDIDQGGDLMGAFADDDSDDDDDSDEEEETLRLMHRRKLRDDEDQDSDGDYEDGYVEGEDQIESDSDEEEEEAPPPPKGKKRPHADANGHTVKEEPKTKKSKKKVESSTKAENESKTKKPKKEEKTNGLEMEDLRVGNGAEAKFGKQAAVYYTGRLKSNGKVFDSCTKGKPFRFRLGAGDVIRGWDEGVKGMRVGGKRRLTIPPSLAYGSQRLPDIPPNSTLVFDVELKHVF